METLVRGRGRWLILAAMLALLAIIVNSSVLAASVNNGGFETGSLAGWSQLNTGTGNWTVYSGSPAPPQGAFAVYARQYSTSQEALYQDIVLEPNMTHLLTLWFAVQNRYSAWVGTNLTSTNQHFRIDIIRATASPLTTNPADTLVTLFATSPGSPLTIPYTLVSGNLTPFAGQTVRLRIGAVQCCFYMFPSIDNVTITSTPSGTPPSFTSGSPADGTVGTAYSHTFTASGTPAPTFALLSGSLPPGLSLSSGGVLSGTPTTSGSYTFTIRASNSAGTADQNVTLTVNEAPTFTSGSPANGTVGTAYSHTFTASGVPSPTFSVSSGSLPPGLNLTGGVLNGAPTTGGVYNFSVTASNGIAPDATQNVSLTIDQSPGFTSGAPANGVVGTAYSHTFTANGYPVPSFSITSGTLPPGLSLSGGVLSGIPTTAGSYSFTVTASNGIGTDATQNVTLVVDEAPGFTSGAPANGVVGTAYSHPFTASGSPAPTYSVTSGSLPPGLNLNAAGLLDGTPTTVGSYSFTVTASNGIGSDATQNVTLVVDQVAGFSGQQPSPPDGTVGVGYTFTFIGTGSPAPTFNLNSGSLPPGLSLNSATGVLSGVPTQAGPYNFAITASNGVGPDVIWNITITIYDRLPEPPAAPACANVNADDPGMLRTHFTHDADRAGLNCRLLAANGQYMTWLGGPITFAENIGNQTVLDLGVIAAVDVFKPGEQNGFAGDVVVCLKGSGYMIYLNAAGQPRVPQLWSTWTTDAFPGYTCTTLYAPGTVVLVSKKP